MRDTGTDWGSQDSQMRTNGHGPNQLAMSALVPKSEVGFRIQVTAANSQAEIEQLVEVIGKLANAFDLRPARPSEYAA